jgi:ubiquinone/menaquinone biosynthesis C-methylase UbiE
MYLIKKIYYWFHKITSKSEERGEISSGYYQDKVRNLAFKNCSIEEGWLLEVGCGEGFFLNKIVKNKPGLKVAGIDIFWPQLHKAKIRGKAKFNLFQADATLLPFKDNSFDFIVCINVLLNLPTDTMAYKSFREMARLCKKNGKIIFDIRNIFNPLICLRYKLARYYDATIESNRLRLYSLNKIRVVLEEAGLKITKRMYIGLFQGKFAPIIIIEAVKK